MTAIKRDYLPGDRPGRRSPHREQAYDDPLVIAQQVVELHAVMKRKSGPLGILAQAVVDGADRRIADYRSGYSAGWSHGRRGEAMQDRESAQLFFRTAQARSPQEPNK